MAQGINEVPDEEEPVFDAENPTFDATPRVPSHPPPQDPIDALEFQAEGDPLSPDSRARQADAAAGADSK